MLPTVAPVFNTSREAAFATPSGPLAKAAVTEGTDALPLAKVDHAVKVLLLVVKFAGAYVTRPVLSTNVAFVPRENVTRGSRTPVVKSNARRGKTRSVAVRLKAGVIITDAL